MESEECRCQREAAHAKCQNSGLECLLSSALVSFLFLSRGSDRPSDGVCLSNASAELRLKQRTTEVSSSSSWATAVLPCTTHARSHARSPARPLVGGSVPAAPFFSSSSVLLLAQAVQRATAPGTTRGGRASERTRGMQFG